MRIGSLFHHPRGGLVSLSVRLAWSWSKLINLPLPTWVGLPFDIWGFGPVFPVGCLSCWGSCLFSGVFFSEWLGVVPLSFQGDTSVISIFSVSVTCCSSSGIQDSCLFPGPRFISREVGICTFWV